MSPANRNALWGQAIAQELQRAGVAHACISPGSRSTPLALALTEQPGLICTVHHDERSAAFFALGCARQSGQPVALLCTSGTAAANYLPAVVEASLSGVPLLVLTADRPPEARGWGAPQTIDQVGLFGGAVRWAVDLPPPEATEALLGFLRQTIGRAVATSLSAPRGPVHVNVPLRDPLPPIVVAGDVPASLPERALTGRFDGRPALQVSPARSLPPTAAIAEAAAQIAREPHGIIAVGPALPDPALARALRALAEAAGYPLLAEATSSLRTPALGESLIHHGELLARSEPFTRDHAPCLSLRLGQALTPRALTRYVDGARRTVLVGEPGRFVDPGHRASLVLAGDPVGTLEALTQSVKSQVAARSGAWLQQFQRADAAAERALLAALAAEEKLGELHVARALFDALPAELPLVVASSMPIRDLESVAARRRGTAPVHANRGANGIDGTLSTALGVAQAAGGRAALLVGDVALLHDLNALVAARGLGLALTVVLVNNDGGGIFSFLEVAAHVAPAPFEKLWGTPHGVSFGPLMEALGARHTLASSREALPRLLASAFTAPGVEVIEVQTERTENVVAHRRVFAAVDAALEGRPWLPAA